MYELRASTVRAFCRRGHTAFLIIDKMIFVVDTTLDELAVAHAEEVEELFTKLLSADRGGRHLAVISRAVCDWVEQHVGLSWADRGHLNSLRAEYATRGSLQNSGRPITRVVIGDDAPRWSHGEVFSIGHKKYIEGAYSLRSALVVVEDVDTDGELYQLILREVQKIAGGPCITFDVVHGGGTRMPEVFDRELKKGVVAVCIIDSDKSTPLSGISGTAKKMKAMTQNRNAAAGGVNSFIGDIVVTNGREVENYIPYKIVEDMKVYANHPAHPKIRPICGQLDWREGESDALWLFFDVKQGLAGAEILKKRASGEISPDEFEWLCNKVGVDEEGIKNVEIEGFGPNIVKNFFRDATAVGEFHRFVRMQCWRKVGAETFDGLLWYLAAPPAKRV